MQPLDGSVALIKLLGLVKAGVFFFFLIAPLFVAFLYYFGG